MKWKTITPIDEGGLGIKKTKVINQTLLAKGGLENQSKEEAIWARTSTHKYLRRSSVTKAYNYINRSDFGSWRGFYHGINFLIEG